VGKKGKTKGKHRRPSKSLGSNGNEQEGKNRKKSSRWNPKGGERDRNKRSKKNNARGGGSHTE